MTIWMKYYFSSVSSRGATTCFSFILSFCSASFCSSVYILSFFIEVSTINNQFVIPNDINNWNQIGDGYWGWRWRFAMEMEMETDMGIEMEMEMGIGINMEMEMEMDMDMEM